MPTYDFYASGALDITKPAKEMLIERVNAINGLRYDPEQFVLSAVVSVSGNANYDTSVWAMPVTTSQWSDGFEIFYKRIDLNAAMAHGAEVQTSAAANLYDILPAINTAYGLYLTTSDVFDDPITYSDPTDKTKVATVDIQARATSVLFKGSITIDLNKTISHGVSTYYDELIHFMAIRLVSGDKVVAYDSLGNLVTSYNFLSGATVTSSYIKNMFKKPDGTLLLLGAFTYQTTNIFGETNSYTRKVISLDRTGKLTNDSAGNLYGTDYVGVVYAPDFEHNRVYALDTLNNIGGVVSGLHVYHDTGTHDNDWVPTLTSQARCMSVFSDKLYVVTQTADEPCVLHRLLADATVDPSFTPVTLTFTGLRGGIDSAHPIAVHAGVSGVAVLATVNTINGEVPWGTYSKTQTPSGISPSVAFVDHQGAVVSAVGKLSELYTSNRTGVAHFGDMIVAGESCIIYSAELVSPVSGVLGNGVACLDLEGNMLPSSVHATTDNYPAFTVVASMYPLAHGDIVVGANTQVVDNVGMHAAASVYLYGADGLFATREATVLDAHLVVCASHIFLPTV